MNERLKELAAEAYRRVNPGPDPHGEADAAWMGFGELEKVFAELIVKECADIASQCAEWAVQNPEDHILKRFDLYKTPAEIKAHFGVEQ